MSLTLQQSRIHDARLCVCAVAFFVLGGLSVWFTFIKPPELDLFEIEKARVLARYETNCWYKFSEE